MNLKAYVLTTLVAAMSLPVAAETRTPSEEANVEVVQRLLSEGWGATDGWEAVWREVMAPDFTYHFHAQPPQEGIEAAIAFNAVLFMGFPDLEIAVEEIVADGDVVVVRSRLTGAQTGPFLGAPPSGAEVDVPDLTLFRFDSGRLVEQRYFTDLLAVMTVIGAVEAPGR